MSTNYDPTTAKPADLMDMGVREAIARADIIRDKHGDSMPLPTDAEIDAVVRDCFTASRRNGRAVFRMRSRVRKDASARSRFVFANLQFHGSGGGLWGIMGAQFLISDAAERDRFESLAVVLTGGKSSGCDAWKRALHGRETKGV